MADNPASGVDGVLDVAIAGGQVAAVAPGIAPGQLELELTEPSLFLRHAPGAADRFAQAIAERRA